MSEKKTRLRKTVNYAKLSGGADSDDDFQAFSPPNKVKKTKLKKDQKGSVTITAEEKSNKQTNVADCVFEQKPKKTVATSKELVIIDVSDDDDFQPSSKYKKRSANTSLDEKQTIETVLPTKPQVTVPLLNAKPKIDEPRVENLKELDKTIEKKLPDADKIKNYLRGLDNLNKDEVKVKLTPIIDEKGDSGSLKEDFQDSSTSEEDEEPKVRKTKMDKPNFTTMKSSEKTNANKSKQNKPVHITRNPAPVVINKQKPKVASINSSSDLLQHVKPVNLPSVGLRVGLSRKRSAKPLHPNLKMGLA